MNSRDSYSDIETLFRLLNSGHIEDRQFERAIEVWTCRKDFSMLDVLQETGIANELPAEWQSVQSFDDGSPDQLATRSSAVTEGFFEENSISGNEEHTVVCLDDLIVIEHRFERLELIASGATSDVFKALHKELNRHVALKVLSKKHGENPASLNAFLNEARVMAMLEHPCVPSVFGVGKSKEGLPCIAIELMTGKTLAHHALKFHQGIPDYFGSEFDDLISALSFVCLAANHAHQNGFAHRDIKPENIFLGGRGEVYLGDWGLASQIGKQEAESKQDEHGQLGTVSGTLPYVAPERIANRRLCNAQTDVYAVGVTLYQLLVGRLPWKGDDQEIRQLIRIGKYQNPREIERQIPKPLEQICLKAMATSVKERYQDVLELKKDLDSWSKGLAVTAYDPLPIRARRMFLQNSTPVFLILVILVSSLSAFLFLSESSRRKVCDATEATRMKNNEVVQAHVIANQEKEQAIRSIQKCQQIVNQTLFKNSGESFLGVHVNQGLRLKLLNSARDYYLRFLDKFPNLVSNETVRNIRRNVAIVSIKMGDYSTAEKELQICHQLCSELIDEGVADDEVLEDLAGTYHSMGQIKYNRRLLSDAQEKFEEAIRIYNEFSPSVGNEAYECWVSSRAMLATIYAQSNQLEKAKAGLDGILEQLDQIPPEKVTLTVETLYLRLLINVSNATWDLNERKQVELYEERFEVRLRNILAKYPDDDTVQECSGTFQSERGLRLLKLSKIEKGKTCILEAVKIFKPLSQRNPGNIRYLEKLFIAYARTAFGCEMLSDIEQTLTASNRALEVYEVREKRGPLTENILHTACITQLVKANVLINIEQKENAVNDLKQSFARMQLNYSIVKRSPRLNFLMVRVLQFHFKILQSEERHRELNDLITSVCRWLEKNPLPLVVERGGQTLVQYLLPLGGIPEFHEDVLERLEQIEKLQRQASEVNGKIQTRVQAWETGLLSVENMMKFDLTNDLPDKLHALSTEWDQLIGVVDDKTLALIKKAWYEQFEDAGKSCAWRLATDRNPELRDGKRALEFAQRLCEISEQKNPRHLECVAAAYAEMGQFENAIRYQKLAIDMSKSLPNLEDKRFRDRLESYESGKPIRSGAKK